MEKSSGELSPASSLPHCLCQLCRHQAVEHVRKELTMTPRLLSAHSQQLVKLGAAAAAPCGCCPGTGLTADGGGASCVVSRAWCDPACSWLGWSMLLQHRRLKLLKVQRFGKHVIPGTKEKRLGSNGTNKSASVY